MLLNEGMRQARCRVQASLIAAMLFGRTHTTASMCACPTKLMFMWLQNMWAGFASVLRVVCVASNQQSEFEPSCSAPLHRYVFLPLPSVKWVWCTSIRPRAPLSTLIFVGLRTAHTLGVHSGGSNARRVPNRCDEAPSDSAANSCARQSSSSPAAHTTAADKQT
jgi:hypothetical protein